MSKRVKLMFSPHVHNQTHMHTQRRSGNPSTLCRQKKILFPFRPLSFLIICSLTFFLVTPPPTIRLHTTRLFPIRSIYLSIYPYLISMHIQRSYSRHLDKLTFDNIECMPTVYQFAVPPFAIPTPPHVARQETHSYPLLTHY